jgi:hypothetical protein
VGAACHPTWILRMHIYPAGAGLLANAVSFNSYVG